MGRSYIPKIWEEIFFETVLLKLKKLDRFTQGTRLGRPIHPTNGMQVGPQVRLQIVLPSTICTPTWLRLGFQLIQVRTQVALQVAPKRTTSTPQPTSISVLDAVNWELQSKRLCLARLQHHDTTMLSPPVSVHVQIQGCRALAPAAEPREREQKNKKQGMTIHS